MFNTVRNSRKLYAIALNRLADYRELLRIELKLQGRGVGLQALACVLAALCAFIALLFIGAAIIVSAWDSPYRIAAAWLVVLLYAALAAGCLAFVRSFHPESTLSTLRNEWRRDMDALKESL